MQVFRLQVGPGPEIRICPNCAGLRLSACSSTARAGLLAPTSHARDPWFIGFFVRNFWLKETYGLRVLSVGLPAALKTNSQLWFRAV